MHSLHSRIGTHEVAVEIGGMPVLLRTQSAFFRDLLTWRYDGFVNSSASPRFEFDVELIDPGESDDADVEVRRDRDCWSLRRGDFRAQWDPEAGTGRIRQSANPYSIDSVLRIVHSLALAEEDGFLLHSASAIRGGRAFLFSGVSGAGKTTISRLAPGDVTLLSDEISYVRRTGQHYVASGTPFTGELAQVGENCSAPIAALFLLEKGRENLIEPVAAAEALRSLLRNILFFTNDPDLVKLVFRAALDFIERVPVWRLTFLPDERVWNLIV